MASVMRMECDGPLLCFGGPYSNLQALEALLAEAERLGIPTARMLCTGDVVAYCAEAAACVDLMMATGIPTVMGNCEESLAEGGEDCGCGFDEGTACDLLSRGWFAHASRQVTPAQRAWMAGLPRRIDVTLGGLRLVAVHGGAEVINRFLFASADDAVLAAEITATGVEGVLAGHCGQPFTRVVGGRLWHNAGAIGMPADDSTPRTWFSLLTPMRDGLRIERRALVYDHAAAAAAMRRAGLAEGYTDCLATGLWPSCDVLPPTERARRGQAIEPSVHVWSRAGSA
ncbi:metallophosphoesterase family protein [Paracraurococcus lichenis]|uniref:Metallophosphoesterase family protein n=1 Tax=Paracraurococcus lichenis TaxID=3064888 RepID=A0ABT9ECM6_9PROT|nr:metallophosphoesterase family protein [Paracraurococcus sp. LOR1-02]MDO9713864.1 metallophosphoesterase family protein [Paracraurococcus sp. LOR1-02]